MQTSRDRILTTHTGSLPRLPELRALLVKKDQGEPYDETELEQRTREAVLAIVRRQRRFVRKRRAEHHVAHCGDNDFVIRTGRRHGGRLL